MDLGVPISMGRCSEARLSPGRSDFVIEMQKCALCDGCDGSHWYQLDPSGSIWFQLGYHMDDPHESFGENDDPHGTKRKNLMDHDFPIFSPMKCLSTGGHWR